MITIVAGTNRRGSETEMVARTISKVLDGMTDEPVKLLCLTDLPEDFVHKNMYHEGGQSEKIGHLQDEYMLDARKFWFVLPEYNGGIPGILKLFIDAISVRQLKNTFHAKKACLTGVSTGRAGNLRGIDHLTNILNYLQVVVMPMKIPISLINHLTNEEGDLADEATLQVLRQQARAFLKF